MQAEAQLHLSTPSPNSPDFPLRLGGKSALWAPHEPNPLQDMGDRYQDCLPQEVPSATTLTSPPHPVQPASVHVAPSSAPLLTSQSCAPISSGWEGGSNASCRKHTCVLEDLLWEGHTLPAELYMSYARFIGQELKSHWTARMDPYPSTHRSI